MRKVYVDANVFLDYWGDRRDSLRPLGEFAFRFLQRAINCEFSIILSELTLFELAKQLSKKEIESLFEPLKERKKLIFVEQDTEDARMARMTAHERGVPWQDVLHCLLANKAGAEAIITRDRHFEQLGDLLQPVFPEGI